MKLKTILGIKVTGLVAMVVAGALFASKGKADPRLQMTPAAVVLTGQPIYNNDYSEQIGWGIEVATSSPGAPVFKKGDNLASALALLRAEGFQITGYAFLTYTAIR